MANQWMGDVVASVAKWQVCELQQELDSAPAPLKQGRCMRREGVCAIKAE